MTWPQRRVGPGNDGNRSEAHNHTDCVSHSTPIAAPVDNLLSRLDRVRKVGRGWTAKCPAHEDRTASLSIASGTDGRCLVHCFAGCSAPDVLAAIGLQLADLYEKQLSPLTPEHRRELRQFGQMAAWRAAVNVLSLEASVAHIAAYDLLRNKPLNADDCNRLALAVERIADAKAVLIGH